MYDEVKNENINNILNGCFFGLASADYPESPVFNETGSGPGAVEPREKPVEAVEQTGDGADQTVPALNRFKEERKQYLIY